MMGWLHRSTSTPAGFVDRKRVEPGAAFALLENHWKQAMAVMDNPNSQNSSSAEDALTVISHLNQMISFLRLARNDDPEQNCKNFWIRNRCSDKAFQWLHKLQIKGTQLLYEDEKKLVQTLESLCELASNDGELLGYGYIANTPQSKSQGSLSEDAGPFATSSDTGTWDGACSLSSLLLEYSLKSDPYLGEPARNSFIILIGLASRLPELEKSFSKEMGLEITNVVISGLSACFAQLPTFNSGTSEQLDPFVTQLEFVDSVTRVAPPKIALTIADCFSNAFLHSVILPALTQSLHEEIAVVTNYFKLVCKHLTHPLLIKSLMVFIVNNLLPVLLHRMSHPNISVTVSTLGLLSTLLTFYCEDLWYQLILRHLMTQNHLMVSQRSSRLPDIEFKEASLRFLSLIPTSVVDAMGPEAITHHYLQYLDNELTRLSYFISDESPFPLTHQSGSSTNLKQNSKMNPNPNLSLSDRNPVYPLWKYKYDGTDEILPLLKQQNQKVIEGHSRVDADCVSSPELNLKSARVSLVDSRVDANVNVASAPLMSPQEESCVGGICNEPFTTISLQPSAEELLHSLGSASNANSEDPSNPSLPHEIGHGSDGYGSLELEIGAMENSSSFGPFLDILLNHLRNLSKLPPDMILMVTEIMSTLASSRIPLVTSILLDTSLILQPSYVSFPLLLNRIRVEFDQSLRNSTTILYDVWTSVSQDLALVQSQNSPMNSTISSSSSMNFIHSLSNSFDTSLSFGDSSFTESLKKKISNNSSFGPFLNNVFQRKSSIGSVGKSPLPSSSQVNTPRNGQGIAETRLHDSPQSIGSLNRSKTESPVRTMASPEDLAAQNQNQRLMAMRAIYFSHWLLEMASIAQQLCWTRPAV